MPGPDRLQLARDIYGAYETGDRRIAEELLTDDFVFYSPPDPGIDRATYFERCWPTDGNRFRNTEVLTFAGDKICKAEVYFGWDLD